ncbi:MAG TPA: biotin/lipoyl-binding protein [Candidatus Acidoferrales bacterium]|nr:biotin/lipoyl-binding protein [Candidatus Acidoferrales bacterium]
MLTTPRIAVAGLSLVALALLALIGRDVFLPPSTTAAALRLATVTRGTVRSTVTATGTVVPVAQVNLSFKVAGTLAEVDVRAGDRVSQGQVVAKLDPTNYQNALDQARANLASAQANLQSALSPLTGDQIAQLQHALANAQQSYSDTVSQVNNTNTQDASAVAADQAAVTADQTALNNSATYQQDKLNLQNARSQLQTDQNKFSADGCAAYSYPYTSPPAPAACAADFSTVSSDQTTVNTDQSKVNTDEAPLKADQSKLSADQSKQNNDALSGQRSVNQAAQAVTSAQDNLTIQTTQKPNQIASAQASLLSAQVAVNTAQQNLNYTVLTAPMDGVVNSLTGTVGENVSAGTGVTATAPGSTAPLPTTGSSSSGAGSFMVISNDKALQAVVLFAEPDVARLAANQEATVTFDALQGVSASGKLVAVNASATVVSNVVNYYATVSFGRSDPRLKPGMTANASVTVAQAANALLVPNLAITRIGGQATVMVYSGGQQVRTPIETGVVGDQYTEVTAGLNDVDRVVLPTPRTPSGTTIRGGQPGAVRIG